MFVEAKLLNFTTKAAEVVIRRLRSVVAAAQTTFRGWRRGSTSGADTSATNILSIHVLGFGGRKHFIVQCTNRATLHVNTIFCI